MVTVSYDETPEEYEERTGRLREEEAKRDEGMARAAANSASTEDAFIALCALAKQPGLVFNTDEIHMVLERVGKPMDNKLAMGSVIKRGLRAGVIVRSNEPPRKTSLKGGHARSYQMYVGKVDNTKTDRSIFWDDPIC